MISHINATWKEIIKMLTEIFVELELGKVLKEYEGLKEIIVKKSITNPFELNITLKGKVGDEKVAQQFTLGVYDSEYHFLRDVEYFIESGGIFHKKGCELT